MKITIRQLAWLAGGVLAFGLCNVEAAQGTVIVGSTGKPMAGVHVVAAWDGSITMPVQPSTRCYHAEATVTDERGRFSLSSFSGNWNPLMWDRTRNVWALAPGYVTSEKSNYSALELVLVPGSGERSTQFKALPSVGLLGCGVDGRRFLPFLKALKVEADRLAGSPQELSFASEVSFEIDVIERGKDAAHERANMRMRREALGERK